MTHRADRRGHAEWCLRVHFIPDQIQVPWSLACRAWTGAVPSLHHMEHGTLLLPGQPRDLDRAVEALYTSSRMLLQR